MTAMGMWLYTEIDLRELEVKATNQQGPAESGGVSLLYRPGGGLTAGGGAGVDLLFVLLLLKSCLWVQSSQLVSTDYTVKN